MRKDVLGTQGADPKFARVLGFSCSMAREGGDTPAKRGRVRKWAGPYRRVFTMQAGMLPASIWGAHPSEPGEYVLPLIA